MLITDNEAQAQRRGRAGVGVYAGPRGAGVYYGSGRGYYDGRYYDNRYYDGRYYDNRYYDGRYYGSRYYYPSSYYYPARTSYYYGPSASRYYYYWTNGWYVCQDRYTGDYWYRSGGSWYRWR
jgi:hypothetical protein